MHSVFQLPGTSFSTAGYAQWDKSTKELSDNRGRLDAIAIPSLEEYAATICNTYAVTGDFSQFYLPSYKDSWFSAAVFEHPQLHKHVGTLVVTLTEQIEVFGARFLWVGVPYPSPCIVDTIPIRKCMVCVATKGDPRKKEDHIWCIITVTGDTISLEQQHLQALLSKEINAIKKYIERTGDRSIVMASTSAEDTTNVYMLAGKDMVARFGDAADAVLNYATPAMMMSPTIDGVNSPPMYPIPITQMAERRNWLGIIDSTWTTALARGTAVASPFTSDQQLTKDEMRRLLAYLIHAGQFVPEVKDALLCVPLEGNTDEMVKDPMFKAMIRLIVTTFDKKD